MKKFLSNGLLNNISTRLNAGLLSLGLLLIFGSFAFTLFFFSSSPASAAIFATFTPTEENSWAFVNVSKPTYTPTLFPTSTPVFTETPGTMEVQVLADTPVPVLPTREPVQAAVDQASAFAAQEPVYSGTKYILVDISDQHMYVYEGDTLIYSFVASTGMNNATATGTFAVQSKIPNAYGSTWDIWMPHWLGIYWSGGLENGIHALPILANGATLWEGYLGRPISYGCVVLGTYEAALLYDWAEIGTTVEIRW
jgi:lipoprotein-anchoring transpeptidase ErfK/SrfK